MEVPAYAAICCCIISTHSTRRTNPITRSNCHFKSGVPAIESASALTPQLRTTTTETLAPQCSPTNKSGSREAPHSSWLILTPNWREITISRSDWSTKTVDNRSMRWAPMDTVLCWCNLQVRLRLRELQLRAQDPLTKEMDSHGMQCWSYGCVCKTTTEFRMAMMLNEMGPILEGACCKPATGMNAVTFVNKRNELSLQMYTRVCVYSSCQPEHIVWWVVTSGTGRFALLWNVSIWNLWSPELPTGTTSGSNL